MQTQPSRGNELQDQNLHYQEDFTSMITPRWLVAIPIMVVASFGSSSAWGSAVLDRAEMFSRDAVHKANAQLEQLERATKIPVVIETVAEVPGLDKNASHEERLEAINSLAVRRDNALKDGGVYLLISKNDHLNSNVLVRERFASLVPRSKRESIGHAFLAEFKKKDFDGGLLHGVQAIERALEGAAVGHRAAKAPGGLERSASACRSSKGPGRTIDHGNVSADHPGHLRRPSRLEAFGRALQPGRGGWLPRSDGRYGHAAARNGPRRRTGLLRWARLRRPRGRVLLGNVRWARRSACWQLALRPVLRPTRRHDLCRCVPFRRLHFGNARQGVMPSSERDDGPGGGGDWGGDGGAADTGGGDWGGGGGDWGGGGGDWGGGGGGDW